MRRIAATFALALSLLGCGSTTRSGEPVQLLTGTVGFNQTQCSTYWDIGKLVVDPTFGTALDNIAVTRPVVWRMGFTGRRIGSEVEVLDPAGNVVAVTGRFYRLDGGTSPENPDHLLACLATPHDPIYPA